MKKLRDKSYKTILYITTFSVFSLIILKGDISYSKTNTPTPIVAIQQEYVEENTSYEDTEHIIDRQPSEHEIIDVYVDNICNKYDVEPGLIKSIIYQESRYNPNVRNGYCVGLMQVSTYWHNSRASKLGITDFYDPYNNILLGVDYLSELFHKYKDKRLALMLYSMDNNVAFRMYNRGEISDYVKTVLEMAEKYKKGE